MEQKQIASDKQNSSPVVQTPVAAAETTPADPPLITEML